MDERIFATKTERRMYQVCVTRQLILSDYSQKVNESLNTTRVGLARPPISCEALACLQVYMHIQLASDWSVKTFSLSANSLVLAASSASAASFCAAAVAAACCCCAAIACACCCSAALWRLRGHVGRRGGNKVRQQGTGRPLARLRRAFLWASAALWHSFAPSRHALGMPSVSQGMQGQPPRGTFGVVPQRVQTKREREVPANTQQGTISRSHESGSTKCAFRACCAP